jgi:hypothetical protein
VAIIRAVIESFQGWERSRTWRFCRWLCFLTISCLAHGTLEWCLVLALPSLDYLSVRLTTERRRLLHRKIIVCAAADWLSRCSVLGATSRASLRIEVIQSWEDQGRIPVCADARVGARLPTLLLLRSHSLGCIGTVVVPAFDVRPHWLIRWE